MGRTKQYWGGCGIGRCIKETKGIFAPKWTWRTILKVYVNEIGMVMETPSLLRAYGKGSRQLWLHYGEQILG